MPLFLTDEEFQTCCNDAGLLVEKADAFIQNLFIKLDTFKAELDAASTTAEQTCSLLEQKYLSLSSDYAKLESENSRLKAEIEQRVAELAQVQAEKHQLHLNSIGRDGEFERLMAEVSENQKAKRQMMELAERKELEISEKNDMIKTYLDKIVSLTENAATREGKLNEIDAELQRTKTTCTRYAQEKELVERHNIWLNDELTAKVNTLIEIRSAHFERETEMSSKLAQVEKQFCECSKPLEWHKERVRELEMKLGSLEEKLLASKSSAMNDEERFAAEIATANKLVELYKERSEELSKKAGELEGVILALETRSTLLEQESKEKVENEISARKELEKDAATLREQLEKCEAEIEAGRKTNEQTLMHSGSFENSNILEESQMLVPKAPAGVSGTALAASLLREGWSLTTMYCKYQEAVDALRHEQLGKKNVDALLQRILKELEDKAEAIMDERAEHEKILDAYSMIDEKLQHSLSEKSKLEKMILGLQADIRRKERDYAGGQRDIVDLQKQVTLLLKECRDVQLRCGLKDSSNLLTSDSELSFNDVNGLVEQNVQLRSLVRRLTEEVDHREKELKETFESEIKRHTEEAASRVSTVLQRVEEQAQMIESLHTSVAMYKKLYEEEQKWRSSPHSATVAPERKTNEVGSLHEESHAASSKAQEQSDKRARHLEDELSKIRGELLSIKRDRDKMALEANLACDRLENFMKEFEHQREESHGILARNIEFSQIIVDYQRKIRESSDMLHAAEDLSRKLKMEMSILKHEKEVLLNAEKRACDEVQSLSERVYRLQASLDAIHCAKEIREEARVIHMKKQEEHIQKIEREWAEAKKELQEERDKSQTLTHKSDEVVRNATQQVENIGKELSDALKAVTAAEARAADAEIRYKNLENRIRFTDKQTLAASSSGDPLAFSFEVTDLYAAKQEIEKLKDEVRATKNHMTQYKNIAQVNEVALRQMEAAHEEYKKEAEKLKCSLEAEISSLRDKIYKLENESVLISKEAVSASSFREEALESAMSELSKLKDEYAAKCYENEEMKVRVSALNEGLEREHQRWATAQANYERQVILQSETIQELTKTSKELSLLREEVDELRRVSDVLKSDNVEVKQKWEAERLTLCELKSDAEKKYNDINEQNKILHCRLEAFNTQLAEQDRGIPKSSGKISGSDTCDSGMQVVVSYLRRSKEIAETEISLLKQEKLRLQSKLESALKASAASQSSLQAERSISRALLLTEDEIKALQLQVREINVLRESNMHLREENKHNFEECQELHETAQKNKTRMERLQSLLREKENEIEACRKEIERYKTDKSLLEKKASELLQKSQNIDVNEYNRMKEELNQIQFERCEQMEQNKKLVCEKQDLISRFELDLANSATELKGKENRLNEMSEVEANMKSDLESQKKFVVQLKKQCGLLSKQKEELNRANTALQKQLDETIGKGSGANDQAMKEKEEKDRRIQILEKTIERLREELHKRREESRVEKSKRAEVEKVVADVANRATQERTKFVDELEKHKQALKSVLLGVEQAKQTNNNYLEGNTSLQLLTTNTLDENAALFLGSCDELEKMTKSVMDDLGGSSSATTAAAQTTSALSSDAAVSDSSPCVVTLCDPSANQSTVQTKDEKERRVAVLKPSGEVRRPGRRLVRPRLTKEEVPQGDVEMPEVDAMSGILTHASAMDAETKNLSPLIEQPARKRGAVLSEPMELSVVSEETDASLPVSKKSKVSDINVEFPGETVSGVEIADVMPAVQEQSLVTDLTQDATNEVAEGDDDAQPVANVQVDEETMEISQREGATQDQIQNDDNIVSGEPDKQGTEMSFTDDAQKNQEETSPLADSDKEEGELDSDVPDAGDGSEMNDQGSPQVGEEQSESLVTGSSPITEAMDEGLNNALEADNSAPPEFVDRGQEAPEVDAKDVVDKGCNTSNDGNNTEQATRETDAATMTTTVTEEPVDVSNVASNTTVDAEESNQTVAVSTPTTINLNERARLMAQRRQAGMISPTVDRSAGRTGVRGRTPRGRGRMIRGRGRGQAPPSEQS